MKINVSSCVIMLMANNSWWFTEVRCSKINVKEILIPGNDVEKNGSQTLVEKASIPTIGKRNISKNVKVEWC